jgi:hypothetical protein
MAAARALPALLDAYLGTRPGSRAALAVKSLRDFRA